MKGWSSLDQDGRELYDPEKDRAFVEELKREVKDLMWRLSSLICIYIHSSSPGQPSRPLMGFKKTWVQGVNLEVIMLDSNLLLMIYGDLWVI